MRSKVDPMRRLSDGRRIRPNVSLPVTVYRQLLARANLRGQTLSEALEALVRRAVETPRRKAPRPQEDV